MPVSVDIGAFSGCQHRSILERFCVPLSSILVRFFVGVPVSFDTGTFPVCQFDSFGRYWEVLSTKLPFYITRRLILTDTVLLNEFL